MNCVVLHCIDTRPYCSYPRLTEVQLLQDQEIQLNELATKTGRAKGEIVQEAVAKMLAHNEWFKQQVQVGLDQIARDEFIAEDEMDARLERMLKD